MVKMTNIILQDYYIQYTVEEEKVDICSFHSANL